MRTTPTQVRFCFFLILLLFVFTYFSENNSYFSYLVRCSPLFSFFLTGKNLVSCEVSFCKKKKNIKKKAKESLFLYKVPKKKLGYLFYHSILSARELRHYKILLDYVYGFHCEDVATLLFSFV